MLHKPPHAPSSRGCPEDPGALHTSGSHGSRLKAWDDGVWGSVLPNSMLAQRMTDRTSWFNALPSPSASTPSVLVDHPALPSEQDEGRSRRHPHRKSLSRVWPKCPGRSLDATLEHKKIPLPLFRICSIPILTFDNELPRKDHPPAPAPGN
ncbi:hypothetical protein RHECNPAF_830021 [Rhizobium etli CNPAF512]|nr:hypothetical protein RHECNPAF_830021 [Rhizobium etli CNPAF512]